MAEAVRRWVSKMVMLGGMALLVAGCSSIDLDNNAQVEDRTGSSQSGQAGSGAGAGDGAVAKTSVVPVDADKAPATTAGTNTTPAAPAGPSGVIYFDYDSYAIKPEFQSLIDAQARLLRTETGRKVVIEGHTDERGGREYNLALGQRRADAVRRALGLLGVADSRIEAVSFGKEKPTQAGSGEAAWSKNRRAEIYYR